MKLKGSDTFDYIQLGLKQGSLQNNCIKMDVNKVYILMLYDKGDAMSSELQCVYQRTLIHHIKVYNIKESTCICQGLGLFHLDNNNNIKNTQSTCRT